MNTKLYLWKLSEDKYYEKIEGLFLATEEEIELINDQEINLGEILGKHSEVSITISDKNLTQIILEDFTILQLLETFSDRTLSGYNPFKYADIDAECNQCGFIEDVGFYNNLQCPNCQSKDIKFLVREDYI